jgi:DNA replication protein DnaC
MATLKNLLPDLPEDSATTSTDHDTPSPCALCGDANALCGGMGLVRHKAKVGDPNFGKLYPCPNKPQATSQERRDKLLRISNLGAYAAKTFEAFNVDLPMLSPYERQSLETALIRAQQFADAPEGWLVLQGKYGCGKTHLAAAIGNARVASGEAVLFITTPDLLDHLRSTYAPTSDDSYDETFERLRNTPLLILDDLGTENPSAWAAEKLFQLLNHRHAHRLPTVITTNADLGALDERLNSRLRDAELVQRYIIRAPDYRTGNDNADPLLSKLSHYNRMTFDTFDTKTNLNAKEQDDMKRHLAFAKEYAQTLGPVPWVAFSSVYYGSGKTHLAAAIGNAVQAQGRIVTLVTAPDLLDYLRDAYSPDSTLSFDKRFRAMREVPLLILDDLNMENAKPWAREKLFQLLDHRYVLRLPTVITVFNLNHVDGRLRSRLVDPALCRLRELTAIAYAERMRSK